MLILNQEQVKKLITMKEAIEINEDVYISFSTGESTVPLRTNMELDTTEHFSLIMPSFLNDMDGLGVKVVTIYPENVEKGIPATQAVVMLFDTTNGVPIALMDGTFITGLRTGSGTGVATDHLAHKNASTLAIIGTGGMAPGQLEAVEAVRDITTVYVYNRTKEKAENFISDMQVQFPSLEFVLKSTPKDALADADIVVTTTATDKPIVKYEWLKSGAHVNAIGGFNKYIQEVDEELMEKASVRTVDGIDATLVTGDLSIPIEKNVISKEDLVEIGTFIHEDMNARNNDSDITFFKSVGLSSQDIAVAVKIYRKAKEKGIGQEVKL
ncbi:ornithine cyclodeaminase family protein [Virgibacillus sp. W0181]|uniref:ornithine cyclodeaminase family protein n=1 Tax=Virgibacillus sp. W0181 TaxID=3391581 RepID=UPI003F465047